MFMKILPLLSRFFVTARTH